MSRRRDRTSECHDCGCLRGEAKFPIGRRPKRPDGTAWPRLCTDCITERQRVADRAPLPVWIGDKRRGYLLGVRARERNGGPDLADLATPEPFRRLASSQRSREG